MDNLNNSDFLPLLPPNTIKEELLDAGGETANLVCDSVERQVRHSILVLFGARVPWLVLHSFDGRFETSFTSHRRLCTLFYAYLHIECTLAIGSDIIMRVLLLLPFACTLKIVQETRLFMWQLSGVSVVVLQ